MKRRTLRSGADIAMTMGTDESAKNSLLVGMAEPSQKPISKDQMRKVLKRLRVLLGEAIEQGSRVGLDLSSVKLAALCGELIREAEELGYRPAYDDSVEGFFLGGVFDELMQQPSNIFDAVMGLDGVDYYVPLSAENWIACLEALRFSLQPSQ